MTIEKGRIATHALRVVAIVLFVVSQGRSVPGFGLSGVELTVTLLSAFLILVLSLVIFPVDWDRPRLADLLPWPTFARAPEAWWATAVRMAGDLPVKAMLLAVAVVLALGLDSVAQDGPALAAMYVSVGTAAARLPLASSVPVGVVAVVGLLVSGATGGRVDRDLSLVLALAIVFLVAYSVRERRALRVAEGREAVLAERARIAREIHDVLAHSLSAQIVHLEGAKLLLRADRAEEALDRVIRARDLAKSGLEEARRAVSALREDMPGLPVALKSLAADFEDATDLPCHLTIAGGERRITPETELAMTRTAQEALTNIRRHAPGSPATVHLTFAPGICTLDITNPTPPPPKPTHPTESERETPGTTHPAGAERGTPGITHPAGVERGTPGTVRPIGGEDGAPDVDHTSGGRPGVAGSGGEGRVTEPGAVARGGAGGRGGGYGLVGMRERAELLGGSLTAGESDGVFRVHLEVPS
ncbi:sensor histidine kinase [Nonomuraea sp. NPDC050536]|uniref:sensor histidine kinase n=1 Tax=Nonomuraea sp. NPDC050536 TaxID=3364366 RepID=UPI0037C92AE4